MNLRNYRLNTTILGDHECGEKAIILNFVSKVHANLRGCSPEKNSYSRCFQENPHKLYINRKDMKCRIREK